MSYILEALRKADAQRERSRLPGLQAQPHAAAVSAMDRPASRKAGVAAAAVLAIGLGGVAAWQWTRDEAAPVVAPPTRSEASPPAVAVAPAPQPAVPQPPAPAAEILPPAPPPAPAPVAAPAPAPVTARAPAAAAAAPVAPPPSATVQAQAVDKETAKAPELQGAPPGAPSLAVSGGVWSQNPAQRLLIVNGQVFNEGSELAPGVRLEEVKQHRAVLSWRGQRYAVPY